MAKTSTPPKAAATKAEVRHDYSRIKFTMDGPWHTPPPNITFAGYQAWLLSLPVEPGEIAAKEAASKIGVRRAVR